MNLYYAPGACSLAPHIVMREAGIPVDLKKVDLKAKQFEGGDYKQVNGKGYVPAVKLDDGSVLTEAPVIMQYLADQKPDSGLAPKNGTFERYQVQEWLNFLTSEVHKQFSPLFRPNTPEEYKPIAKENIAKRFDLIDQQLKGKDYLTGKQFTVADAYLFVMLQWCDRFGIDLHLFPNLDDYEFRVAQRAAVQAAMRAEGLALRHEFKRSA